MKESHKEAKHGENKTPETKCHDAIEETSMWESTKEGVAKAWSATKDGAVKAWNKTKEVTENITGFGSDDNEDETAYFEEENIIGSHKNHLHGHRYSELDDDIVTFSESDGEQPVSMHHMHKNSSSKRPSHHA